jgi:beta-lactamase superfamily II metal-dependent hydrolase
MARGRLWPVVLLAAVLAVIDGCSDKSVNPFDPLQDPDPPVVTSFSYQAGVATWKTDEPALCVVEYGPAGGDFLHYTYESTKVHATNHEATLLGMEDGEQYQVRLRCVDRAGNEGVYASALLPGFIEGFAFDGPVMRLSMIDVGWGLSMALETPGGTSVLIDAGRSELGPWVTEFLYDHGISYLDYGVVTHYHADHEGGFYGDALNGIPGVLDGIGVGQFIVPDPTHMLEAVTASLEAALDTYNIDSATVTGGDNSSNDPALDWDDTPGFFVEVLAAGLGTQFIDDPAYYPEDLEGNNDSIVFRITYGGVVFQLMADAEFFVEYYILNHYGGPAVRADLMQVAHHGNDDATSELWLDNVDPRIGLISNAMIEAPLEKEVTLQGLRAVDADYFVTDRIFPNTPRDAEPSYGHLIAITDGETIEVVLEPHDW